MKRFLSTKLLASAMAFGLLFTVLSCSDDNPATDLVTVTGAVYSIEDFSPAEGVYVWLLDESANYITTAATDATGAYSIQVPSGSAFYLVAGDPADVPAGNPDAGDTTDNWMPLINTDARLQATITADMTGWPIHACPRPAISPNGSLATLDDYMENADENEGQFPAGITTADDDIRILAGVTMFLQTDLLGTDAGGFDSQAGLGVALSTTDLSTAYFSGPVTFDVDPTESFFTEGCVDVTFTPNTDSPDAPNCFLPDTATGTDESGLIYSVGNTGTSVDVDFTHATYDIVDLDATPLRAGMFTLIITVVIDDEPGKDTSELFEFLS